MGSGSHLLWFVFDWLPLLFAVDLIAFHLTGDHPLAIRWWWRPGAGRLEASVERL
jgi:hypothetical protein